MRIFMVFRECFEPLTVCTRNEELSGQYGTGDKKFLTIMLEVVASQDLLIWHAFFGIAGANNDINVFDNSSLFDDLVEDITPAAPFVVNEVGFENGCSDIKFRVVEVTTIVFGSPNKATSYSVHGPALGRKDHNTTLHGDDRYEHRRDDDVAKR
ncbi:ALP1-like protein [Tanacetum coccineum]|uniref:ALP1-like protein n=1 Tax=Tanacetum coccineum TaxID=301880 RepID=A0ABQ5IT96_9ASTR